MTTNRVLACIAWFLLIALLPVPMRAELRGTWTASPQNDGAMLQWQFSREHNHHGQPMPLDAFTGLTASQVASATQTPVAFELRRDAGTLAMEGVFRQREGAGHFTFQPNNRYYDAVRAMGVDLGREDDEEKLFSLAMIDVSPEYIRSMQQAGYRVSLDQYMSMRIFRVTPQLVDELRSLGYRNVDFDDLIASRVHRVTPDYIRQMRAAGYANLSLDELVASRIHQATPEFLQKMREVGYDHIQWDDAIAFRIHQVTPEFVRQLRELGYTGISADDLVAMRIHRVTPDYIRSLKNVGYSGIPVSKLIEMRIHGIDADYIAKVK
jgi:hypothetical protein